MKAAVCGLLSMTALASSLAFPQRGTPVALPRVDAEAALKTVAPDLDQRLARFKTIRMPSGMAALTGRERRMVSQLAIACRYLESIYWRQADPDGLRLFTGLTAVDTATARRVRRYLVINGSRWDLVDENRPFIGTTPMPPGRSLYPPDLGHVEIEGYLSSHPDKKIQIYDPYTVVRRQGADLIGRPYHIEFKTFLDPAVSALRRAAALSDDPKFARFLTLRADALLTDDYYASDVAWLELQNPRFDLIFAPYETYLDDLLGVKTSYGAAILVRNEAESRNLEQYQRWVPAIQDALPLAPEDRPSVGGHAAPMEVMDAPLRAGDLRHGYQAVADNLPNDPRIHQEKGAKHIFFKNFMDARVNEIILPLAGRIMDVSQARQASAEGYMATTVMHEICHGLGPSFARRGGGQMDVREAIGATYSGLEEAKADVVGMWALKWLLDRNVFPPARLQEYYASYVAGIFRTIRFGTGEAHGRAEMMEFNVLSEQGAIAQSGGRYRIDYGRIPDAIGRLAKELLEQEATGDRARAEAWFTKYDRMPRELMQALAATADIPVDVDPIFELPERFE
jgi:hypothetical protein